MRTHTLPSKACKTMVKYNIETLMVGGDTVVRLMLADQPAVVLTAPEAVALGHTLTMMGAKAEVYKELQKRARSDALDGSGSDDLSSRRVPGIRSIANREE